MKLFLQKNTKFSSAGDGASGGWGFAPKPPACGNRPKTAPPLRISGYALGRWSNSTLCSGSWNPLHIERDNFGTAKCVMRREETCTVDIDYLDSCSTNQSVEDGLLRLQVSFLCTNMARSGFLLRIAPVSIKPESTAFSQACRGCSVGV